MNKNYSILKDKFPKLLEFVDSWKGDGAENFEVLNSKNGLHTVKKHLLDGKVMLLHSAYDPTNEARKFIEQSEFDPGGINLIIGFGLGYHVEEAVGRLKSGGRVIAAVLNPDVFRLAIKYRDLSELFLNPDLEIIFGDEHEVLRAISSLDVDSCKSIKLIIHRPSIHLGGERLTVLRDIVDELESGERFWKKHTLLIKNNILKNLPYIIKNPGVKGLFGRFSKTPAIIVAPGPSLDKNFEYVRPAKGKALIVVVGFAQRILYDAGIRPDLVVSIDPHFASFKYHEGIDWDVPLIYRPPLNSNILPHHKGRKIAAVSDEFDGYRQTSIFHNKGRIELGGSVGCAALDIAIKFGCDPIILVGMDLAPKDGSFHTKELSKNRRVWDEELLFHRKVKGIDGRDIYTYKNYYRFLKWIERRISNEDRTFIDATEGGAKKEGTIIMPLREAIDKYCVGDHPEIAGIFNSVGDDLDDEEAKRIYDEVFLSVKGYLNRTVSMYE